MITRINLVKHGNVPKEFIDLVLSILRTFYTAVGANIPLVDLHVYETVISKRTYIELEGLRRGVSISGDFIVLHEAWSGIPRIHICYEELKDMDLSLIKALIIHEAAHSVLHGSIIYYTITPSLEVMELLGREKALVATYIVSTAVKDYEVTKFLIRHGYLPYVLIYVDYVVSGAKGLGSDFLSKLQLIKLVTPLVALKEVIGEDVLRYVKLLSDYVGGELVNKVIEVLDNVLRSYGTLDEWVNGILKELIKLGILP